MLLAILNISDCFDLCLVLMLVGSSGFDLVLLLVCGLEFLCFWISWWLGGDCCFLVGCVTLPLWCSLGYCSLISGFCLWLLFVSFSVGAGFELVLC